MKTYILVLIWWYSFNFLDFSRPPKFDAPVTEHNNKNHTLIFTAIFNYFTTNVSTRIKSRGFPDAISLPCSWNDMFLALTVSSKHPSQYISWHGPFIIWNIQGIPWSKIQVFKLFRQQRWYVTFTKILGLFRYAQLHIIVLCPGSSESKKHCLEINIQVVHSVQN